MLYATTRNPVDAYTPQRVMTMLRGPEGGLFVPFRIPVYSREDIASFHQRSFNASLAELLNLQLNTRLSGYDLDLVLGRQSVRLQQLGQKILMAECWHNTGWCFTRMVEDLMPVIHTDPECAPEPRGWARMAVRIGVLFGIFGALMAEGMAGEEKKVDIAMVSGDFEAPMAAWYARQMGLPIGNIICCCNENGNLWDFICHGQLKTDGTARLTSVPEGDSLVPEGLERLISACGGPLETERYVQALHSGSTYYVTEEFLNRLRKGLYVTVSSEKRIRQTMPAVWATHRYPLTAAGALAYAGLQDYRARTRETRPALILTETSPRLDAQRNAAALGISPEELLKAL